MNILRKTIRASIMLSISALQSKQSKLKCTSKQPNFNNLSLLEIIKIKDYNFLATFAKCELIKIVEEHIKILVANSYKRRRGNSSRLIYGEKGIGKSLTFEQITNYVTEKYPDIIPIYIQYESFEQMNKTPKDHLIKKLKQVKILKDLPENQTFDELLMTIENNKLYLLLIVDELDQVYTSNQDLEENQRHKILGELAYLGNNNSGRVFTIICGSSSHMPLLISKNAVHNDEVVKQFPLVKNAPNLNETKFRSMHFSSGVLQDDLQIITSKFGLSDGYGNFLYFIAGSNLRYINDICDYIKQSAEMSLSKSIQQQNIHLWDSKSDLTYQNQKDLINSIYSKLAENNKDLLEKLKPYIDDQTKFIPECLKIQWLTEIKPLTNLELNDILKSQRKQKLDVFSLIDKNWICSGDLLSQIYPSSGLALVFYHWQDKNVGIVDKVAEKVLSHRYLNYAKQVIELFQKSK